MTNYLDDQGSKPQLTGGAKARDRSAEHGRDQRMHSRPVQQERQIDGSVSNAGTKPTKAPLQTRVASPPSSGGERRSGMETAMGALADKLHQPRRR